MRIRLLFRACSLALLYHRTAASVPAPRAQRQCRHYVRCGKWWNPAPRSRRCCRAACSRGHGRDLLRSHQPKTLSIRGLHHLPRFFLSSLYELDIGDLLLRQILESSPSQTRTIRSSSQYSDITVPEVVDEVEVDNDILPLVRAFL